jgi:hypothetical protein
MGGGIGLAAIRLSLHNTPGQPLTVQDAHQALAQQRAGDHDRILRVEIAGQTRHGRILYYECAIHADRYFALPPSRGRG